MNYKSFYRYLTEGVEKYLIWEPTGEFRQIADKINQLSSSPDEVYRADSDRVIKLLKRTHRIKSLEQGNTRKNAGTYVSSDIYLAGAFAMRYYRDGKGGNILIMNKNKLPNLVERDSGNFTTDYIPLEAVKEIIDIKDFISTDIHGIDDSR